MHSATPNASSLRPSPQPRAILYLRQSAFRDESISLESQEYITQQYAEQQGYVVVGVESDGATGRTWSRPGVQAAMRALDERRADVIVLWKWSRLSRSRRDWAVAADRADLAGGRIESATEPVDTDSAAGRFQRGVMVEMAAFESERIGETWRETHEWRRRHGLPATGGERWGYVRLRDSEREPWRYEPHPVQGPLLADLYRWYLGGMGAVQLTRKLHEAGMLGVTGKPFSYQQVMQMLDSGFGAGLLARALPRKAPVWERTFLPGAHPPVIDDETWAAYVSARYRRRRQSMPEAREYVLTGVLRCGECGGPMSGKLIQGRRTYSCSRADRIPGLPRVSIIAWRVEQKVEAWLEAHARDVEQAADAAARASRKRERLSFARESLQAQLAKADERLVTLTMKLADGTLTDQAYQLATASIEAERAALHERLQLTVVNPVEVEAPAALLTNDVMTLWPRMTVGQRAKVLRDLIDRVVVHPAERRGQVDRTVEIVPRWEA